MRRLFIGRLHFADQRECLLHAKNDISLLKSTREEKAVSLWPTIRAGVFEKYAPNVKRRRGLRPEQLIDPVTSQELGIQENDLWIAAQALEYNLVWVTNDKMERIRDVCEELQIENWAR